MRHVPPHGAIGVYACPVIIIRLELLVSKTALGLGLRALARAVGRHGVFPLVPRFPAPRPLRLGLLALSESRLILSARFVDEKMETASQHTQQYQTARLRR